MIYLIIGAILVLVGLIFLLDGLFKTNKIIKNRTWSIIIGGVLIAVGFFGTGFGDMFQTWTAPDVIDDDDVVECVTFDITPSVSASGATLGSSETQFTVPAMANTTSHVVYETDNTTWVNPAFSFLVRPIVPAGMTADDLGTIYYEVTNPELTTDDGTDTYKLFTKSSGNRQLIWTGDGTQYVEGTSTMLMTENVTLLLTMTCSSDSFSRVENTFDPITAYIKFSNGCGWSQTYMVDFELISQFN